MELQKDCYTGSYSTNPAVYAVNQTSAINTPTISGGAPTFYSITPSLPAGLSLDAGSGVISGTPAVLASATTYTITAANAFGSTQTILILSVNGTGPSVVTGSASGITYSSSTLNGTVNPNGLATSIYFQYGMTTTYSGTTSIQNAGNGTGAVSFSASVAGLNPSITYHYQIVAANTSGTAYGSDQTFTTTFSPPSVPTGLIATAGDTQVALVWNAATGASGYNLKRSQVSGSNYSVIASNIPATGCTDSSVVNGTAYYYVVSALNASGESGNTPEVSARPTAPITSGETATPPISVSAGNMQLTVVNSVIGHTYQLQRNDTMNAADWTNIGSPQVGNGGALVLQNIGGSTGFIRRFYRVSIQQ